jgi:hypothetical protein
MKSIIHKVIASIVIAGLLKFTVDMGLYLMNQPYDFTFFAGLMINVIAAFVVVFAMSRVFSPDFTTIKDLFTKK